MPINFFSIGYEAAVRTTYWGSRAELIEVLELAQRGQLEVEIETFTLDDGPRAYERLYEGSLRGRAVIVPNE